MAVAAWSLQLLRLGGDALDQCLRRLADHRHAAPRTEFSLPG
jgi:hypothetical protein